MQYICIAMIAIYLGVLIEIQLWFGSLGCFNTLCWIEVLISPFFFWNHFIRFWNSIYWWHSKSLSLIIIILTTLNLSRCNSWKFCLLKIIIITSILVPFALTKILHRMCILIILAWLSDELCLMLILSLIVRILISSIFAICRYTSIFRNIDTRIHLLSLFWGYWSLLIHSALIGCSTNSITLSWTFNSCLSGGYAYLCNLSISFFRSSISKSVTCACYTSYLFF
jgi:hypothetical protein